MGARVVILLLVLTAYFPVVRDGGFIWDDDQHVVQNPVLEDARGLAEMWTRPESLPQFYPLTHTVFWLERRLFGLDPRGFHLVNVLLHGLVAVALWRVLESLEIGWAAPAAALFALHPIEVETVAWITELKNLLSALFALTALGFLLRWWRGGDRRAWGMALWAFILALLSKSVAATLPAAFVVIVWWLDGPSCGEHRSSMSGLASRRLRRLGLGLLPFFVVGIGSGLFTAHLEKVHVRAQLGLSFLERLQVAGHVVWFYPSKLIWPHPLVFSYPRWQPDPADPSRWLPLLLAMACISSSILLRRRLGRGLGAAWLVYVVTIFPALGFIDVYPMRYAFTADHFQYMAGMPLLVLGAEGLRRLPGRPRLVFVGILLVFGWLTWRQGHIYEGPESLWRDVIAHNPSSWMARNNLGLLLLERGDREEARRELREAIALAPGINDARVNLARLEAEEGRHEKAREMLEEAARLDPTSSVIAYDLGLQYLALNRAGEALHSFDAAIAREPDYGRAWVGRGHALAALGRAGEAASSYRHALDLDPGVPGAWNGLGIAALRDGDWEAAVHALRQAVTLHPDAVDIRRNLGLALRKAGRVAEARKTYRELLVRHPDDGLGWRQLGNLEFQADSWVDAVTAFDRARAAGERGAAMDLKLAWSLLRRGGQDAATWARLERLALSLAERTRARNLEVLELLVRIETGRGRLRSAAEWALRGRDFAGEIGQAEARRRFGSWAALLNSGKKPQFEE